MSRIRVNGMFPRSRRRSATDLGRAVGRCRRAAIMWVRYHETDRVAMYRTGRAYALFFSGPFSIRRSRSFALPVTTSRLTI
jgi:hypothetical protein